MIYFIGSGPGAVDLITVRGAELLKKADLIIYAGSLINPEIIKTYAKSECEIFNSASMTLEDILEKLIYGHENNLLTIRLHSGDPSIYGAIREQMNYLRKKNIPFEVVPGVSSFCAAAASLKTEYMIPEKKQSLIISRLEGRTAVPEKESLKNLAQHNSSMAIFLSSGKLKEVCENLIAGGYSKTAPAVLIYKASWPEEKIIKGTLESLSNIKNEIKNTGLILVGEFLNENIECENSKLYDKNFSHNFRS